MLLCNALGKSGSGQISSESYVEFGDSARIMCYLSVFLNIASASARNCLAASVGVSFPNTT